MPPKVAKIIPQIGYPFNRILGKHFSISKVKIGVTTPIIKEAKGSIITDADELKNIPA